MNLTAGYSTEQVSSVAASSNGEIVGIAVGVSLGTSLVTTLITLGIVYVIRRASKKPKKEKTKEELKTPEIRRQVSDRSSGISQRSSASSTRALTRGQYESVSTTDAANGHGPRYRSDWIARWCTDKGLTEQTASTLRQNGFTSKDAIESLHSEMVPRLQLNNMAQECILRKAVSSKNRQAESTSSGIGTYRQKSTSEENIPSLTINDQSGNSSVFERTHSVDHLDGAAPMHRPIAKKRSMGSMEIIQGDQTIIIRSNSHEPPNQRTKSPERVQKSNPKNFKGLLSDSGLHELSAWIGHEWSHLSTMLEIPPPTIAQIQMDNPQNIRQQIFEMLRLWRDNAVGNKEQVKGVLHRSLEKVGRPDLAEDLLLEQVEGSAEKVAYQSIV